MNAVSTLVVEGNVYLLDLIRLSWFELGWLRPHAFHRDYKCFESGCTYISSVLLKMSFTLVKTKFSATNALISCLLKLFIQSPR